MRVGFIGLGSQGGRIARSGFELMARNISEAVRAAALATLVPAAESLLARLAPRPSVAERYFAAMRARDVDAVLALFAEGATLHAPDGRTLAGLDALRGWFTMLFGLSQAPTPTCTSEVASPGLIATQISTQFPDGTVLQTANFFHLDQRGAITALYSYKRG